MKRDIAANMAANIAGRSRRRRGTSGISQAPTSARWLIGVLAIAIIAAVGGKSVVIAEQAGEGESCRKYLPSIGRTVEAPCERAPSPKSGVLPRLPLERQGLRVKLAQFAGDSSVPRGWLGVRISDLLPSLAKLLDDRKGVFTNDVTPQGPADIAGLRPGDIILTINGREPKDARDLALIVQGITPGSEATVEFARVGQGNTDLMQNLRDRADAGSVDAMMTVGALLQVGVGGVKDEAEAERWYRKAADLGNVEAMTHLGEQYSKGLGVAKDQTEAARWFRKGADAGDAAAMTRLAYIYRTGQGMAKDEAEAARWFRKGAEAGNVDAMRELALIYDNSLGVPQDGAAAAYWLFSAIKNGDASSINLMAETGPAWSADFRKELQNRLRESGVYAGPSDGKFGPAVSDAIAALAARARK